MAPIEKRRFLFVTGKGGTGKTTVTAALATALEKAGKRVLIAVSEPKERISELLGVPPLGPDIVAVGRSIYAVKISPEAAMREYGEMILKSKTLTNAVFGNKYVRGFFAAVPGLYQWAMLGKAWFHSTERDAQDRPRFDVVLFDAPATGHGLEMLRVPKVIVDIVPPGVLRRDAEQAWRMFQNPDESGVIVVSLPEDMPVNESLELSEAVQGELGLPIAAVVLNQLVDPIFSPAEREVLSQLAAPADANAGSAAIAVAARRATTERLQDASTTKLASGIAAPLVKLPRLIQDPSNPAAIHGLGELLGQGLGIPVSGTPRPA
jgi:anion-transporting  ArsA/GET3 family ATPase